MPRLPIDLADFYSNGLISRVQAQPGNPIHQLATLGLKEFFF